MQGTNPRLALIGACVAALAAFSAAPASAAAKPVPVTGPAVSVTPTTATLTGTVSPGGVATVWEFGYSPASNAFQGAFTAGGSIPAGVLSNVAVSDKLTGLTPGRSYTYQLFAGSGTAGSYYYPPASVGGGVLSFKTPSAGSATLLSRNLKVKKGRVKVPFKCSSTLNCHGKLKITSSYKQGKKVKKVACGSATFTVKAGKKKTVTTGKVSAKCKALLVLAKKNTIKAKLGVTFTTFQKPISAIVKLKLSK